tara:strand:- start:247 stop:507 length:261 start_codon:yes stop_codon:yes gene_type:complete
MGRMKDYLFTFGFINQYGEYDMGQTEDLLRENMILQKNIKDLQGQLNQAHQRIKHLVSNEWSNQTPDHSSLQEVVNPKQMDLKLNE